MEKVKALLDVATEKLISRKFLVWLTATALVGYGLIDPESWVSVTVMYVGSQALVDLATQWKHGK